MSRAGPGLVVPEAIPAPHPRAAQRDFTHKRPRSLGLWGKGALPTTSPPHIVSTGGSRGRARAVPLAAPHAAGGRNFPTNTAARLGSLRSGSLESPPDVPPTRESGPAVGGGLPLSLHQVPAPAWGGRWLPLGYLLQCPPTHPPPAGHLPSTFWLHSQAGQVGGDTLPTVGTWTGLPRRKAAWSQPIRPQGHGWLFAGQWPPQSAQLGLSQWTGGWAREGPVPGWGTGSWSWGAGYMGPEGPGRVRLVSAPAPGGEEKLRPLVGCPGAAGKGNRP